ncbi:hypothetical protein GLYMA_18G290500v4 [Glycine max]|nr:hypothetical protein GLYMA_18G290500v4 [Glycine max]KAH1156657.1 hypothetical protein GYH30_051450 [Glycine max]
MYRMECVKINTLWSGEIDCDGFEAKLLCHKDKPAIVNVNIGTTVKGAMDDLDLVIKKLEEAGFSRDRFYIHCDGALFGLMLSFVKRVASATSTLVIWHFLHLWPVVEYYLLKRFPVHYGSDSTFF